MKQFFTESCIQSTTHVHRMILAFTSHIRKHKKIVHIIMPLPCQKSKSRTRKLIESDFKLFYNVSHNKAEDNNTVHTTYTRAEDMVKTQCQEIWRERERERWGEIPCVGI
jgi:hypothetical protein